MCSAGVGYGKSTLVCNALPLLREHCTNEAVKAMLNESRFPLAIHLTFSTKRTDFNPEIEKSIPHAVIRRMLCHCLPDLSWNTALRLPLSDFLQVEDCLGALVAYHREVCGLRPDQEVFVYLGVDEINKLFVNTTNGGKRDLWRVKKLCSTLKGLSDRGNFYVATLMAGTHLCDTAESFLGPGITPEWVPLTPLSPQAVIAMLKSDAGITEDYFRNDKFIRLLEDIGPVMRGLGVAVQALSNKMSVAAVDDARRAAEAYLAGKLTSLKPRDADALIGLVVSGYPVASNGRVCNDSEFTLDDLQNAGTIYLVPSPDSFNEYRVDMSRLAFNALLAGGYGRTRRGAAAAMLLGCLDSRDWSSFKKFVALQHFLKKEVFNERSEVGFVKLSTFFSGAAVGDKLQSQLLKLDTSQHRQAVGSY